MRYLILFAILFSCQKEMPPECQIEQIGVVRFENQEKKRYSVSIDNISATFSGGFVMSGVSAGEKEVRVIEHPDGILMGFGITVVPCDTTIIALN